MSSCSRCVVGGVMMSVGNSHWSIAPLDQVTRGKPLQAKQPQLLRS